MKGPALRAPSVASSSTHTRRKAGVTFVEVMLACVLSAMLLISLAETVRTTLNVHTQVTARHEQVEAARFAVDRMVRAVENTWYLFIPKVDNGLTLYDESDRDPGVLAVTLDEDTDLDLDDFPDADNDGDGLFDEDPGGDLNWDLAPGIVGIDDDNDGFIDEQHLLPFNGNLGPINEDDDEDNYANEDEWDGVDNDGDGQFDEDVKKDTTADGLAGVGGVDDDDDGSTDEGDKNDDDEDGLVDEDWLDTVVFRQVGTDLIERIPVPWDQDASGTVNGADYLERVIATGVSQFRVRRLSDGAETSPVVEITLSLDAGPGEPVTIQTEAKIGD